MFEFLNGSTKEFFMPGFAVVFSIVYASAIWWFVHRMRERRNSHELRLHTATTSGLANGQIEGVDDLVNIYRGITNSTDDDVAYKAAVSRVLRRILVSLATDDNASEGRRQLKRKIKQLLAQIEVDTPFAELPPAERNLVIDARRFIQSNELQAATQKVEDLANLIEARQDAYLKLQSANKWSVPLAVVGLVFTVIFGVMSLWP